MEYIIISLLIVVIILLLMNLFKKTNDNSIEVIKNISEVKTDMTKTIGDFKYDFSKSLQDDFETLNIKMEKKLNEMNDRVNMRLDESLDKTNKTFNNVLERLTKIDEAQKNIDVLSKDIVNLQSVLTDKKTRGTFGEVNLNYILTSVFGERKDIYDIQHKLSNGAIADSIIYGADPIKNICIDSKFPLENYERMTNKELSKEARTAALKLFETDVKKHINDIADKYIIPDETADQAIMFLPAEAVFAELNAYHEDLLKYAYERKVWICGPTTLMSTLSTVAMILKNIERDKYSQVIHQELNKLGVEFSRYKDRWDKLSKSIDTVSNEVKDIHTTTDKITKRFASIQDANVKELTYNKDDE
ncbi:MAG: DNA recombination protein RmuC [Bacilli bacterium]|nr:DNA recombination protein RmuC [Bacilli bacterium]